VARPVAEAHGGGASTRRGCVPLPITFGPVRSRRLGWSLGINNVRPKSCTYSCVYCQVGPTDRARRDREPFLDPDEVVAAVGRHAAACRHTGQPIDYATFVPDGEPTLDTGLGASIRGIRASGLRVAVLTNGSLLWRDEVRDELAAADLVSVKIDAVDEATWRRLNRPIGRLALDTVLDGIRRFAASYRGDLLTETMLVAGVNDDGATVRRTAAFVGALEPLRAYVAVPTRPPAAPWVQAPSRAAARHAADIFRAAELPTTCLVEEVDDPFVVTGDPADGLVGIVAVHPMTEAAARAYLDRAGADWSVARGLLDQGRIVRVRYGRQVFLRAATGRRPATAPRPPEAAATAG